MYIRRKVFSVHQDENGEQKLFSTTEIIHEESYQKEFGAKSVALGVFAPGAYQAKEAAKYGYDEEDYKKVRGDYALRGLFTPGTATYVKKIAEKMAKEGKSKEEIREYLEDSDNKLKYGLGEVGANILTGGVTNTITGTVAQGVGLVDKLKGNRAYDKKKKK